MRLATAPAGGSRARIARARSCGFQCPRMTTTDRDALTAMEEGDMIWNLIAHTLNVYTGTAWKVVTAT